MCVRVLVVFLPRCWQRPGDQYLERGSHPVIYTRCTPGGTAIVGSVAVPDQDVTGTFVSVH